MTEKPFPKTAFKYLIQECLYPYKWQFLICILLVASESGVYNMLNWLFAGLIDGLKLGIDKQVLQHSLYFVAAIIGCDIINIFLPKITIMHRQKYLYFPLQEVLYGRALKYILGHSANYIINKQTGSLLAKTNQITGVQSTLSMIINALWSRISDISLKVGLLMIINVWLGILFVVCAAVVAVVNYYANKSSERLSKMQGKSESLYTGLLVDTISNIRTVKQFNRLNYEKQRLSVLLRQYIKIKKQTMLVWFTSYTCVGCFVHICSLSVLTFSVYLWSISKINIGDIVFVLLTLNGGFMWLMELCVLYRHFENGLAYIQAGLDVFNDSHEIEDMTDATELKIKKADIEFENVSFAYPNGQQIFTDFNLKIKAGERVGIVGLSGNGKTTLINLLQRAYDIQSGRILIDGQDIKTVTQQSLHQNIAVIPQEAILFHRSIRDNIAYGLTNITDQKIKQAAQIACADEFIKKLPQSYDTMVGDRGCTLSGGERQRIAIARAVLRNNPILILDEATSSLDSEAEQKVSKAINNLLGKRTVIAIAHRLSTLKEMDRIVFLEQGKIVEEGTFADLAAKTDGKFAKLWQLQQINEGEK